MLKLESGVDDRFIVENVSRTVTVRNGDVVNDSARVRSRENKADLTDDAVEDLLGPLDELVGVDRQRLDVLVLYELLSCFGLIAVVEVPVAVNTVFPGLENSVP